MTYKTCKTCGKDKPPTAFYKNGSMADGHLNVCKECHKERMRQYMHFDALDVGREIYEVILAHLARIGIPAQSGKQIKPGDCPIVAYGCVRVAVLTSRLIDGHYRWGLRSIDRASKADVVVLVCDGPDQTFHVFDTNSKVLIRNTGKRKVSLSFTPGVNPPQFAPSTERGQRLTDDVMEAHKDAWHLLARAQLRTVRANADTYGDLALSAAAFAGSAAKGGL